MVFFDIGGDFVQLGEVVIGFEYVVGPACVGYYYFFGGDGSE